MKWEDIACWGIIGVNIILFSYVVFYIPWSCDKLAQSSGGGFTCGLTTGAYLIAIVCCVVAAAAALFLIRE